MGTAAPRERRESTSCPPPARHAAKGPPSPEGRTKVWKGKAALQKGERELHSSGTEKRVTHLSGLIINIVLWLRTELYKPLSYTRHAFVLLCVVPPKATLPERSDPARSRGGWLLASRLSWGGRREQRVRAAHSAAGTQACASTSRTALWLFRSLSKTSSKRKGRVGCSFFLHSTLLMPFFFSPPISQSFH